ncbi:hypothetical protein RSAG8_03017, partial [Rhizoctonia solani AG-8 WAC10335]
MAVQLSRANMTLSDIEFIEYFAHLLDPLLTPGVLFALLDKYTTVEEKLLKGSYYSLFDQLLTSIGTKPHLCNLNLFGISNPTIPASATTLPTEDDSKLNKTNSEDDNVSDDYVMNYSSSELQHGKPTYTPASNGGMETIFQQDTGLNLNSFFQSFDSTYDLGSLTEPHSVVHLGGGDVLEFGLGSAQATCLPAHPPTVTEAVPQPNTSEDLAPLETPNPLQANYTYTICLPTARPGSFRHQDMSFIILNAL